ncbi:MAG: hypothetical protein HFG52_06735 [Lachnospiraceae bacterium]|nr:hypothetical protein [Lachnospiraceae bacterium]
MGICFQIPIFYYPPRSKPDSHTCYDYMAAVVCCVANWIYGQACCGVSDLGHLT